MQRLLNMWNKEEKTCSIMPETHFLLIPGNWFITNPYTMTKKSQRTWFLRNKLTSWYVILYDKNVGCNIYLMNLINRKEACRTHATSPPILTYYLQMQEFFFFGLTKKKNDTTHLFHSRHFAHPYYIYSITLQIILYT